MKKNKYYSRSYSYTRRSYKQNWRTGGMSNAFKHYLDYYVRIPAMRTFYQLIEETIEKIFGHIGVFYEPDHSKKVKAQLAICYSSYPSGLATVGAIGHTAWVQYKTLTDKNTLFDEMEDDLFYQLEDRGYTIESETFSKVFKTISEAVGERLVMEELCKGGLEQAIESYRFFLTSFNNLKFESLPRIIRAVILFGDILPYYETMNLHPLTKDLFSAAYNTSVEYFIQIKVTEPSELQTLGKLWIEDLSFEIGKFLPKDHNNARSFYRTKNPEKSFADPGNFSPESMEDEHPGFNKPSAPLLEEFPDLESMIRQNFKSGSEDTLNDTASKPTGDHIPESVKSYINTLADVARTISNASGQNSGIEDIRSDILMDGLSMSPFEAGLVEGSPAEGNDVEVDMGEHGMMKGQIFDQAYELSFNMQDVQQLNEEAEPLTSKMKNNIFPNTEQLPVVEKLRSSGMIDPGRLSGYKFSQAIFKRFVNEEILDKRGKPLVLIVCDGSGSMSRDKMHMLKILTAAWINSTLKTTVQIMAGIYNDGYVGKNRYGPIVRWLYHPAKTPAASKKDAIRAIANVADSGSGGQQDAKSIAYMLQEADKFARGKRVYLIHITDTGFIRSFNSDMTAEEEVFTVLKQRKQKFGEKFHYTLVGLGVNNGGKTEQIADKMICLPSGELTNPYSAASKIGLYVSSCMKERNRV